MIFSRVSKTLNKIVYCLEEIMVINKRGFEVRVTSRETTREIKGRGLLPYVEQIFYANSYDRFTRALRVTFLRGA